MTENRNPIGETEFGTNDGVSVAAHEIIVWISDEARLLERARQIIEQDKRDGSALFPWWVEFMLFGSPKGGFNLNSEPTHDARLAREVRYGIDRDDFRRINWDDVRFELRGDETPQV